VNYLPKTKQTKLSDFSEFKPFVDWFNRMVMEFHNKQKKEEKEMSKQEKQADLASKLYNEAKMELFLVYREPDGSKTEIYRPKVPKPENRVK